MNDTDDASGEAALPSPAMSPNEDSPTGSMVAAPAAPSASPLSRILQDLHERAAGYATRGPTGP
ncbi:MAG: hypothetical protein ACRYGC_03890 [Janthinobacterium lividum]